MSCQNLNAHLLPTHIRSHVGSKVGNKFQISSSFSQHQASTSTLSPDSNSTTSFSSYTTLFSMSLLTKASEYSVTAVDCSFSFHSAALRLFSFYQPIPFEIQLLSRFPDFLSLGPELLPEMLVEVPGLFLLLLMNLNGSKTAVPIMSRRYPRSPLTVAMMIH